ELLNEDEIRSISRTMSRLGKIDPAVMEAVCNDFMARLAAGGVLVGSHETTERLLRNALIGRDELVDSIMQEVRGPTTTGSGDGVTPVAARVLPQPPANEPPRVAAGGLPQLFADYAARVRGALPAEPASDIMVRLLELGTVNRDIL